jgi:KaiC/GvpD/RAD55 family RecA-like ATPase
MGGPGCGKTVFALQALVCSTRQTKEAGIFVAFEESTSQIVINAGTFGWDLPALEKNKLFFMESHLSPEVVKAGDFDLVGMAVARADGSIGSLLAKLARTDVLVLDDFAMAPMKDSERRDFLEICDDRYQRRSTILTSQMPVAHWHEQIGDPSIADSIMDRLVHNAHRIDLDGESIRKKRGRKPAADDGQ